MVDPAVVHDQPDTNEARESAQVLKFRQRPSPDQRTPRRPALVPDHRSLEPVDDLAHYEDDDVNIDYRHRMLMNVIAIVVVTLLVGVGVWLADTIAEMERDQDCVIQGRQNCAPIEVPAKP